MDLSLAGRTPDWAWLAQSRAVMTAAEQTVSRTQSCLLPRKQMLASKIIPD